MQSTYDIVFYKRNDLHVSTLPLMVLIYSRLKKLALWLVPTAAELRGIVIKLFPVQRSCAVLSITQIIGNKFGLICNDKLYYI